MDEPTIKEEVWQTVQALNRAWTIEGNADKLKNYFHEQMVAIPGNGRSRLEGREACIAGWKAFAEAAKIHYWREIDRKVQLYGDGKFAVVTYYYEISFDMGGQTFTEGGRDMFALVHDDGKWWVVANHFSSYPRQS